MRNSDIFCNASKVSEERKHHAYHVCKRIVDHSGPHECQVCMIQWGVAERNRRKHRMGVQT